MEQKKHRTKNRCETCGHRLVRGDCPSGTCFWNDYQEHIEKSEEYWDDLHYNSL